MMVCVDLEEEYRRHVQALAHYAAVLVGPDDAMDVVNDAVASTLARGSLDLVDDLRAYWFQAVTRTASSWHRSRLRRVAREQRAAAMSVDTNASQLELDDAIRVLDGLSVQQRAVVYFTYWEDLDSSHISPHCSGSTRRPSADT